MATSPPPVTPRTVAAPPQISVEVGRKAFFWIFAFAVSWVFGYALVLFPPILVVGGLIAFAGGTAIVLYPFIGLILYLIMFILRPGEVYPILGALHLERIVGTVTLIAVALNMIQRRGGIFLDSSRQTVSFLVFIGAVALSIPLSYWRGGSVATFTEMLKILSLYLMTVYLVDTRKRMRIVQWFYIFLVIWLGVDSLFNYYTGKAAFAQGIERATGATDAAGNANKLGTTLACTFPLLFLMMLHEKAKWRRILCGALSLITIWGMVLTGSRASLLGFLAALTFLWWRSKRRLLLGVVGVVALVTAFMFIPDQYKGRYETLTSGHIDESSEARVQTWATGLEMFIDHPLFGVGAGCFGVARAAQYSPEFHKIWLESHSLYIQVLTELGLVGAITFFWFVREFLRLNRKVARRLKALGHGWDNELVLTAGIFAGFLVLLVAGVFGHSLYRRTWYLYAGLGLALWRMLQDPRVVGNAALPSPDSPPSTRSPRN